MDRRYFLQVSAGLGYAAAFPLGALRAQGPAVGSPAVKPLTPLTEGPVPVAFLLSANAVVIDFAGPWEVFQDVSLAGRRSAFRLYTVGETDEPIPITATSPAPVGSPAASISPFMSSNGISAGRSPTKLRIEWSTRVLAGPIRNPIAPTRRQPSRDK
jgi:hypothetical protein